MKELLEFWVEEIEKALTAKNLTVVCAESGFWDSPPDGKRQYKWLNIYCGLEEVAQMEVEYRYKTKDFVIRFGISGRIFSTSLLNQAVNHVLNTVSDLQVK